MRREIWAVNVIQLSLKLYLKNKPRAETCMCSNFEVNKAHEPEKQLQDGENRLVWSECISCWNIRIERSIKVKIGKKRKLKQKLNLTNCTKCLLLFEMKTQRQACLKSLLGNKHASESLI